MRLDEAARICAAISGQLTLPLVAGAQPSQLVLKRAAAALRRVADGLETHLKGDAK